MTENTSTHPLSEWQAAALWDAAVRARLGDTPGLKKMEPADFEATLAALRAVFDAGHEYEQQQRWARVAAAPGIWAIPHEHAAGSAHAPHGGLVVECIDHQLDPQAHGGVHKTQSVRINGVDVHLAPSGFHFAVTDGVAVTSLKLMPAEVHFIREARA